MSQLNIHVPKIIISISHCKNLRKADRFSDSDPYVVVSFSHGKQTGKTKVIMDNNDPEWNEKMTFFLADEIEEATKKQERFHVKLDVYDWDAIGRHDHLGDYTVVIFKTDPTFESEEGKQFVDIPLENTPQGTITFSIKTFNITY